MKKKNLVYIIAIEIMILFFLFAALVITSISIGGRFQRNTFYDGIFIDNVPVGNMTQVQAQEALQAAWQTRVEGVAVSLILPDKTRVITSDDVVFTHNIQEVMEEAYRLGRTGNAVELAEYIKNLPDRPVYYQSVVSIDEQSLKEYLETVREQEYIAPTDAALGGFQPTNSADNQFLFVEERAGQDFDVDTLSDAVIASVESGEFYDVEVPVFPIKAEVTVSDLKDRTRLVSSYTTTMKKDAARENNIKLACAAVNGTVLQPGETFSFNDIVGERTAERGYQEAGIITGGDRVDVGLGGGICQVSGTLFNAVLMADLDVTERQKHSLTSSYLDPGRDATVDWGRLDLKFVNNQTTPIYIAMWTDSERKVHAAVYGTPLASGISIDLRTQVIEYVHPPSEIIYESWDKVPLGTTKTVKATDGIRVKLFKTYYNADGEKIEEEEVHEDFYQPVQGKILYNPLDPSPETQTEAGTGDDADAGDTPDTTGNQ